MCNNCYHIKSALVARVMGIMLMVWWGAQAFSHDIATMSIAPDALLVGDMLRMDAERARAAERAKFAAMFASVTHAHLSPEATPDRPESARDAVSLSAIYGVGPKLYADMLIQGQRVTYVAGRAQPVAASDPKVAYRLRAIRVPCVHLGVDGTTMSLCLGGQP